MSKISLAKTRSARLAGALAQARQRILQDPPQLVVAGKLTRLVGLMLEAEGCQAAVGARCRIATATGADLEAEVVGFANDKLFLMPIGELHGLQPNARVTPTGLSGQVRVGDALLGRVLDGTGRLLDAKPELKKLTAQPLIGRPINPLQRLPIRQPLDVGVRAINALLTVGRGQRMGLFAGSGVGKSVLLGMMTRFTNADVIVVGLIGERGREVAEFIEVSLGPAGLSRAVVIAAPADRPPLERLQGAWLATAVAEFFRDQGKHVLLLMDSLTRFAQAQREIALAIGEPPATKGYPPSAFAKLPQLVERAGNGDHGGGSITAFYTVLTEGDDLQDPIADAARAILDGHIVLSRELAEAGLFPAIDMEASISRAMNEISTPAQRDAARQCKHLYATYCRNRDLINVGAYVSGADPELDRAIALFPAIQAFIRQDMHQAVDIHTSCADLQRLFTSSPTAV